MEISLSLVLMSLMLGIGLAMDAFSVSLANGLAEPCMKRGRLIMIAGTFALFQAAMPMIGWICVHTIVEYFKSFEGVIPWIALALLSYIGGKMLIEGIRGGDDECGCTKLTVGALMVQGVATSIDALSVGFTISEYSFFQALVSVILIAAVTFVICSAGLYLGRKFGTKLAGKAGILGGVILIVIGLEIFITGVFFPDKPDAAVETAPRVYAYTDSEDVMPPSITFGEDDSFTFNFSVISSYIGHGSYTIDGNRLTLNTDDGNYTYVFDIAGDGTLLFDADASSDMTWFADLPDGAAFK